MAVTIGDILPRFIQPDEWANSATVVTWTGSVLGASRGQGQDLGSHDASRRQPMTERAEAPDDGLIGSALRPVP